MTTPTLASIQAELDVILQDIIDLEKLITMKSSPIIDKEMVKKVIRSIALVNKVDPDLAIRVAEAESGLNPYALNVNKSGSIDRGLYQWNSYYHSEVSNAQAFDIFESTRLFCEAVNAGNLSWWNSSKARWNR